MTETENTVPDPEPDAQVVEPGVVAAALPEDPSPSEASSSPTPSADSAGTPPSGSAEIAVEETTAEETAAAEESDQAQEPAATSVTAVEDPEGVAAIEVPATSDTASPASDDTASPASDDTASPASDAVPDGETVERDESVATAPEAPGARESIAGELTAGEPRAAELTPGEPSAGELTAGESVAGELTAGESAGGGEPTAGEPTGGEPTGGESVAGGSTAGVHVAPVRHKGPPPPPGGSLPRPPTPKVSDAGKIVSGIVTVVESDELTVTLEDGRLAVLARRHWDIAPTDDLKAVVSLGDRVDAAILARDDPKGRVVLSRSWSLKKKAWDTVTTAVEDHSTVQAKVTSLSAKGIVVDVGGLRGFVPASHLALDPVKDFSEFADQTLELRVLEADQRKERLVLSRRSILLREQRKGTHELLTNLKVDSVITGTVASLADYGAFIELGGVKGLVHLSELSWHRVGHPRDVLAVGDPVEVKVLDVKVKKRRVSLSIRQVAPDPFAGITAGVVVTGPVTRLVDFGAFVDLGGVEGLVHLSELAEYRVSAPEEIVTPGEEVMVKVLSVDKRRRRIELSIRQAVSDQYGS